MKYDELRARAALAAFSVLLQHEKEKEIADKNYKVIEYGPIAFDAWLAADAFMNECPAFKEKPLRFTPEDKKFLLEIIEENSPDKLFREMYRIRGEPLPPWLAERIPGAKKEDH
jgi:hypothetical protein